MDIDANKEKESSNEEGTEQRTFDEKCSSAQVGEWNVEGNHGAVANKSQGSGVVHVHQQQQQQQPTQGSIFCWEKFLHMRSIRVLLVENDDSTRHVVTALLRNCNYEVANAANVLQAWKILEDLNNHIDIILTEVVMPCVSGISLLNKIMSHKTRKNIPVIMMSSHDSMGLVFKCLSKGAVDFLVKPIRKNELKNLWQHVWRRCHSSSGSGTESGTQTQKSVKAKGTDKSGNNTSNEGENKASNGLNDGDESDDGSEAQSSWTKQAVGMDISQALPPMDHVAECPDSTCAQVIRSNAEHSDDKRAQLSAAREGHGQQHLDTGKELETAVHRNVIPKSRNHGEGQAKATGRESGSDSDAANKLDIKNNATADSEEPKFEIGLKRLRGVQDNGRLVPEERYVLRRSEQSAFSRYNTSVNLFKSPNAITGNSSVLDNSNEVAKRESVGDVKILSNDHTMYVSNGVSNNVDMGSTTNNGMHHSTLRSLKNDRRYSEQQAGLLPNSTLPSSYQEIRIPHTHHQNFHSSPHFQNMENQPSSNHEESSAKQLAQDAPQCGSTNVLCRPGDINNMVNCCLNRSASGSNHGSNGQNGSSTAVNAVGNNGESDAGQAGKSDSGDVSGSGSKNKAAGFRFTQREAALLKFRQKKKDRCFEKKVRYQARKRLADQRPRVRGQFVKQSRTGSSNRGVNE